MSRSPIRPSKSSFDEVVHDSDDLVVDARADDATRLWYRDRALARLRSMSTRRLLGFRDAYLRRNPYVDDCPSVRETTEDDATQEAVYLLLATREHVVRGKAGRRLLAARRRGQGKRKDR